MLLVCKLLRKMEKQHFINHSSGKTPRWRLGGDMQLRLFVDVSAIGKKKHKTLFKTCRTLPLLVGMPWIRWDWDDAWRLGPRRPPLLFTSLAPSWWCSPGFHSKQEKGARRGTWRVKACAGNATACAVKLTGAGCPGCAHAQPPVCSPVISVCAVALCRAECIHDSASAVSRVFVLK